jgi:hypothetical protein
MTTEFYGACSTTRTKADIAAVRDTIIEVIEDDPPMTVRRVFFQLVARGVIEKSEQQDQGTVIRLMTEMRLSGELPYKWVVDESRRVRITQTYDNVEDAIERTAEFYRHSALAQSNSYVEIWSEKDTLAGAMPGRLSCSTPRPRPRFSSNHDPACSWHGTRTVDQAKRAVRTIKGESQC